MKRKWYKKLLKIQLKQCVIPQCQLCPHQPFPHTPADHQERLYILKHVQLADPRVLLWDEKALHFHISVKFKVK